MTEGESETETGSSSTSPSSPTCSSASSSSLKFSIRRILDANFGQNSKTGVRSDSTLPPSPDERSLFPAWVFCTRYSDRPSSGSRSRKRARKDEASEEEKRPRTAFTPQQLATLKRHFIDNRYLTEKRRQQLAHELGLHESQIKIWFQNKRAKLKKSSMEKRPSFSSPSLFIPPLSLH